MPSKWSPLRLFIWLDEFLIILVIGTAWLFDDLRHTLKTKEKETHMTKVLVCLLFIAVSGLSVIYGFDLYQRRALEHCKLAAQKGCQAAIPLEAVNNLMNDHCLAQSEKICRELLK